MKCPILFDYDKSPKEGGFGLDNHSMMELGEKLNGKFENLVNYCMVSGAINQDLYNEYDVKRGLRDSNGKGVLTGLTEISDVCGYRLKNGKKIPCDGELYYQGYNVMDLVKSFENRRFAFEETTYLLMFGELPTHTQLKDFEEVLTSLQELSGQFVRDVIMKAPSANIMNALQKSVLTLYSYDENPDDISVANVLRQSLQLIGKIPLIAVYAYLSYRHFGFDDNLYIRTPDKDLSIAENILQMVRQDGKFTELEAKVLDIALVIHAEHGGGNNSTFTNHVVTSSGTDTYSAISASIASLKGPRHGGANLKVLQMFDDIKEHCKDWNNEEQIKEYLNKILNREAFDESGLIYGMGHAVYSISDPRARIFKQFVKQLADEKGRQKDYRLYEMVERLAPVIIAEERHIYKGVSANVDFYSGFVYSMLELPLELYTPMFAIARIVGWSAHRMEELINTDKIIRPAYKNVLEEQAYIALEER